jgi:RNA-binding protein YlmH
MKNSNETAPVFLLISPKAPKFADELSHRDYLGALMSLGIKRECIIDMTVFENRAYVSVKDSIADFICNELESVRHTAAECRRIDEIPAQVQQSYENLDISVSSLRADAVISAVFNLSRNESKSLFYAQKISVNEKVFTDASKDLLPGDTVGVRGCGKFRFNDVIKTTKKGKLRISADLYK